jgi:hypothetical protein
MAPSIAATSFASGEPGGMAAAWRTAFCRDSALPTSSHCFAEERCCAGDIFLNVRSSNHVSIASIAPMPTQTISIPTPILSPLVKFTFKRAYGPYHLMIEHYTIKFAPAVSQKELEKALHEGDTLLGLKKIQLLLKELSGKQP